MLFGYPVVKEGNWLHEGLCQAVKSVHVLIDEGRTYPEWPNILPASEQIRLRSRAGLRDRLRKYYDVIQDLGKVDRDFVLGTLYSENRIAELLSGACDCATFDQLPSAVREPVASLFEFAFGLLSDLGIRDMHYSTIYSELPAPICPFCGIYPLSGPGGAREDLDHYLAKSVYPFAAANLDNLVPMCHVCNSRYKLSIDILIDDRGGRRRAFNPYNAAGVLVNLDQSIPFEGSAGRRPKWIIKLEPDSEEVKTWDDVFHVCERHVRDVLDPEFERWLRDFRAWCRSANVVAETDDDVQAVLERYHELVASMGLRDRAFLKAAVFRMLRLRCDKNDRRLLDLIRDLMQPIPQVAQVKVDMLQMKFAIRRSV